MQTITKIYNTYKFNELSDGAKKKALNKLGDINIDYEWWDYLYDDAERISLKITEFDIDRRNYIKGSFLRDTEDMAQMILKEHGPDCATAILAREFLADYAKFTDEQKDAGESEELCVEFERAIKEEYLSLLRKEYKYLTSEAAIIESIEANEYDFLESGEMA